jgi:hypothetical protein
MTDWFYVSVGIALVAVWTLGLAWAGKLEGPPQNIPGDEPDYDCIAYQLWTRRQFAVDYRDVGFLAPYGRSKSIVDSRPYSELVADRPSGSTTNRPPLLPSIMSLSYFLAGRQYGVIRVVNLCAAAITACLTAWVCRKIVGAGASLICLGLMCWLGGLRQYGSVLLTESLSGMFVAVTLTLLVVGVPRRPVAFASVIGLSWAAAVLSRTALILWVPSLITGLWIIASRSPPGRIDGQQRRFTRASNAAACCMLTMLAALAPWMVRNCVVLGTFMPLGAEGYIQLPSGFSDAAVRNNGIWEPVQTSTTLFSPSQTCAERERIRAAMGKKAAIGWIKANPRLLPSLTMRKLWSEWRPSGTAEAWVLLAAVVGWAAYRSSVFGLACLFLILGDIMMIGATWSGGGRFTYPAVSPLYALAGAGAWALGRLVTDLRGQITAHA